MNWTPPPREPRWTVYEKNGIAPSLSGWRGTFETLEEAQDYAILQAARSRKFMVFEVWTGTAHKPLSRTQYAVQGQK